MGLTENTYSSGLHPAAFSPIPSHITGGVTLGPVATQCIIPNELQLVWNDALGRHRSLMHWKSNECHPSTHDFVHQAKSIRELFEEKAYIPLTLVPGGGSSLARVGSPIMSLMSSSDVFHGQQDTVKAYVGPIRYVERSGIHRAIMYRMLD